MAISHQMTKMVVSSATHPVVHALDQRITTVRPVMTATSWKEPYVMMYAQIDSSGILTLTHVMIAQLHALIVIPIQYAQRVMTIIN